jgi:hypothetical protein
VLNFSAIAEIVKKNEPKGRPKMGERLKRDPARDETGGGIRVYIQGKEVKVMPGDPESVVEQVRTARAIAMCSLGDDRKKWS